MQQNVFFEVINRKIRKPGESDRQLAKRLGLRSSRTIGLWKQGSTPQTETIVKIISMCESDKDYAPDEILWLKDNLWKVSFESKEKLNAVYPEGLPFDSYDVLGVPYYNSTTDFIDSANRESIPLSSKITRFMGIDPNSVAAVHVEKEFNEGIEQHDVLFIDVNAIRPRAGQLYLVSKDNIPFIVRAMSGEKVLIAGNRAFPLKALVIYGEIQGVFRIFDPMIREDNTSHVTQ